MVDPHQHRIIAAARSYAADNALCLRISQNGVLAVAPSDSAQFHSPHRDIETVVDQKGRIDHCGPGLNLASNLPRLSASSPYRGVQSKAGVVCSSDRLLRVSDGIQGHNG